MNAGSFPSPPTLRHKLMLTAGAKSLLPSAPDGRCQQRSVQRYIDARGQRLRTPRTLKGLSSGILRNFLSQHWNDASRSRDLSKEPRPEAGIVCLFRVNFDRRQRRGSDGGLGKSVSRAPHCGDKDC